MKTMKNFVLLILLFAFTAGVNINTFAQKTNTKSDPNVPIFEIKNDLGQTVFAVYPGGVKIFVDDQLKAAGGGFTVGRLSTGKAVGGDILSVTPGNVNIYLDTSSTLKAAGGGFTVGRLSTGKKALGTFENFLTVTPDSTRVYIDENSTSGFAVGQIGSTVGHQNFMHLTPENYFIGHQSGERTTGLYNLFLGYQSGFSNTQGTSNTFLGYQTGYSNTSGSQNVFLGESAGYHNQLGYMNVFIGYQAAYNNIGDGGGFNGTYNVMIGHRAGYGNTTGGGHVIIGYDAATATTTGNYMTAVGYRAGAGATGQYNVFMGGEAGKQFGAGDYNTCVGMSAGVAAQGSGNSYYGAWAGWHNDGSNNTAIGRSAGYGANTFAYDNGTYVGAYSGASQTSGSNNTFIGYSAGRNSTTGSSNVFIGYQAGYYETGSNMLYIANSSTSTPLIYGEFDNSLVRINGDLQYTGTIGQYSDKRLKRDIVEIDNALEKVLKINGVYFYWKENKFSKKKQIGVIAQEVEPIFPELVQKNSNGYLSVDYTKFAPVLIEAVKEQQKLIEQLQNENKELSAQVENLEELNSKLSQQSSDLDNLKAEVEQLKSLIKDIVDGSEKSKQVSESAK